MEKGELGVNFQLAFEGLEMLILHLQFVPLC